MQKPARSPSRDKYVSRLKARGVLSVDRRYLVLLDSSGLEAVAGEP